MKTEKAIQHMLQMLQNELPQHFYYHNLEHTEYVLATTEHLAHGEGVDGDDLMILKTAAVFHDAGFISDAPDHEARGCDMARQILPEFEYTTEQIGKVCKLIMATKLPQTPTNTLEQIICDADLYYLGTDDYFPVAERLYHEFKESNGLRGRDDWNKAQITFLTAHQYFTKTAIDELQVKKDENLAILKRNSGSHKASNKTEMILHDVSDFTLIVVGVIIAAFSLKGFLVPNDFFDGGITGISLLIHEIYKFNLAYVIVIANLPFVIMCIYAINYKFALKTFFCVLLLGIFLYSVPYPMVTSDKLLVSIFGGFFLGVGIGLTMRAGCAVDGIEVLALYTWRKTSFTISEIILALNVLIFSVAAFRFGITTALYSMLTYFTASKTVDYVVEGLEAYTGVTIISGKSEIIKDKLVNELGRGITVYKGERGYLPGHFEVHSDVDIIFTVITRLELRKLKNLVSEVDPNAFVFASTIKEASGGVMKRRHIH
jgi:uncharacterized membrane-anchored protein YitT (DUF2179 family)/predicted metal-dependent HD superfamily phosphohydrolase